ncbi:hypothetical protein [Paratissierella segnis]|jgi:hypothetical protein|uniref:Uncharacterized protein n=1 Tax=Paratissierella segnis TaxID=2763679 RepID=A0A926EYY5_9FIRM|nr:hypothetical protein [Paratissierella segnis]MBC8588964.1 hypothetical protein [Paratissierella segnis]
MESNNSCQRLLNELKEEYGLSPIETKALIEQYLVPAALTASFNCEENPENRKGLAFTKIKIQQLT